MTKYVMHRSEPIILLVRENVVRTSSFSRQGFDLARRYVLSHFPRILIRIFRDCFMSDPHTPLFSGLGHEIVLPIGLTPQSFIALSDPDPLR
jgi:hypothetical protein